MTACAVCRAVPRTIWTDFSMGREPKPCLAEQLLRASRAPRLAGEVLDRLPSQLFCLCAGPRVAPAQLGEGKSCARQVDHAVGSFVQDSNSALGVRRRQITTT